MQKLKLVVLKYHEFENRDLYLLFNINFVSYFSEKFSTNLSKLHFTCPDDYYSALNFFQNVSTFTTLNWQIPRNKIPQFEIMIFLS